MTDEETKRRRGEEAKSRMLTDAEVRETVLRGLAELSAAAFGPGTGISTPGVGPYGRAPMDVFISYAREDAESANRLYRCLLEVPGVTPWLDSKRLLPGVHWKTEIMQALKACDMVILLLSQHSVSKQGFVQREIAEALEKLKSMPPDSIFVIPARLEDCRPKHAELHDLQWVDLFPDWDSGYALIVKAIETRRGEPFSPPSAPDGVVMETIASPSMFLQRLHVRHEMRGCDAMELQFQKQDWQGLDFAGASFVRCHFTACDFRKCILRGANFEGAVFEECLVAGADLWGVNFWGASIAGIRDLDQAVLECTNLFGTRASAKQAAFLADNLKTVSLCDYGSFVEYFASRKEMTEEAIGSTFIWINHRYFRLMFGKNNDSVFRQRVLHVPPV